MGCKRGEKNPWQKSSETIFHADLQLRNLAIVLWSTCWGMKHEKPLQEYQAEFLVRDAHHGHCLVVLRDFS
jgi:hypothetical protein